MQTTTLLFKNKLDNVNENGNPKNFERISRTSSFNIIKLVMYQKLHYFSLFLSFSLILSLSFSFFIFIIYIIINITYTHELISILFYNPSICKLFCYFSFFLFFVKKFILAPRFIFCKINSIK